MNLFRKLALIPMVTALAFSFVLVAPQNSKAATEEETVREYANLSNEDLKEIRDGLTEYGVDKETQEILIEKYNNGIRWDSLTPDAQPVKSETRNLPDGSSRQIDTYEDGSVVAIIVEVPPTISLLGTTISGGTVTSGSGYTNVSNAKVKYDSTVIKCLFYASYSLVKGNYDKISYVSPIQESYIHIIGGSYSQEKINIYKTVEDINGSANVSLTFKSSSKLGEMSCSLKLFVGNDKATASSIM